jgi:DNA-binding transcriptional regulator YiaG
MARELGVSIKTVCNWASNAHPISGPAVIAIQKIFQDNFETQYDSIENHYVAR